jgi:yecA family protein
MKPKSMQSTRYGLTMPTLLPPNRESMGVLSFTSHDFAELDAWLAEDGWPDGRMDSAMLEGFMVALIAWPTELSAGAWLPLIWGIHGWKVAAKIASQEKYDRFIVLVMGMFQELERRLNDSPGNYSFAFSKDAPFLSGRYCAGAAWATGFITALHEYSSGFDMRPAAVRTAVEDIAQHASKRSTDRALLEPVATALNSALSLILPERPKRTPKDRVPLNKTTLLGRAKQPDVHAADHTKYLQNDSNRLCGNVWEDAKEH